MPDSDLLPEIIIDDSAEGYVETDDEAEEEEPPEKSRPPASEIFHSHSVGARAQSSTERRVPVACCAAGCAAGRSSIQYGG